MICYIVGALLIILSIVMFCVPFDGSSSFGSIGEAVLVLLLLCSMLAGGMVCILKNCVDSYSPGLTAAAKLEAGAYSSLKEAEELIARVNDSNAFLEKAKENKYPAWNGVYMSKYQCFDYITVSDEAKEHLKSAIASEFADAKVASLAPPSPIPSS